MPCAAKHAKMGHRLRPVAGEQCEGDAVHGSNIGIASLNHLQRAGVATTQDHAPKEGAILLLPLPPLLLLILRLMELHTLLLYGTFCVMLVPSGLC
jgi:hypothetical protein